MPNMFAGCCFSVLALFSLQQAAFQSTWQVGQSSSLGEDTETLRTCMSLIPPEVPEACAVCGLRWKTLDSELGGNLSHLSPAHSAKPEIFASVI